MRGTGFEPADPYGTAPSTLRRWPGLATHARCLSASPAIRRLDKSAFVSTGPRYGVAPAVKRAFQIDTGPNPAMAKYSTGGGGGNASDSCELCGADGVDLQTATVAGATLQVCSECAQHGDSGQSGDSSTTRDGTESGSDRRRRAAQNAARMRDAQQADSSHWEDGADYDDDQLPYLVGGYGARVTDARQDAGLQTDELADEIEADEPDVLAVEQGRATKAGVGGSVIRDLERFLDVELAERT